MNRNTLTFGVAVLGMSLGVAGFSQGKHAAKPVKAVTYAAVAPILAKNCVKCHQGPKPGHGLNLANYASVMKGDKEGKVVIPGKSAMSRLATVLHGKPQLMPPGHKLGDADIKTIDSWVASGAKK